MIKLTIKYTDFNDNEVEEDVYFHFSQDEMFDYIRENREYIAGEVSNALTTEDYIETYKAVRDLVVAAYGERSKDGRRFVKNEETKLNFVETPRLDVVLEQILESDETMKRFINGILPPKMRDVVLKEVERLENK